MPEQLVVEPEELRKIAEQHELVAANLRKWGEIPHAWLKEFKSTYGSIAEPMRAALVDYYDRRHDKAERLAANHERTRDELIAAAQALEDGDQAGGHQVTQSGGNGHGTPPGGPTPSAPTDPAAPVQPAPDAPIVNGTQPGQPSDTASDAPGMPGETGRSDQAPLPSAASAPQAYDAVTTGATAPFGTTPPSVGVPDYGAADASAAPAGGSAGAAGAIGDSSTPGGMIAPMATGAIPAAVAPSGAGTPGRNPAPLAAGPFAAAAHTAKDRQALPSLMVGEQADGDLVLARTLLAAVLAAVRDSALGLDWAVGVARTPAGPIIVLTSTEGRGWLPPGLFLPSEVTLPWRLGSILGSAGREALAALEGTTDPARMLAESGLTMIRLRSIRLSALVSSAAIPDGLRAAVGDDVAIDEWVSAAESAIDLTAPGVGLLDRLALAGSDELLHQAATVPETEIRAKCLELARAADARVCAAVSGIDGETSSRRARRRRILDALHAGQPVPASWWEQMRAADDMTAATLRSRRVDVSNIPVGGVRPGVSGTEALRSMVFERRADELLLLLAAGEPDRQTLRDVLYAYGQIIEHPLLQSAARVAAVQATEWTGTSAAVADVRVAGGVGPGAHDVNSVSASPIGYGGAPPAIAGLLRGPAGSEGSSEQRRA